MEYPSEEQLKELARKWLEGSLNKDEEILFNRWYDRSLPSEIEIDAPDADAKAFKERVYERIMASIYKKKNADISYKRKRIVWSVAASVLVLLGLGIYLSKQKVTAPRPAIAISDIAPGGNRATLTLSNGQVIYLDSISGKTKLADQGNVQVLNLPEGILAYQPAGSNAAGEMVYNTLSTPLGGQYQLLLPDGTKVWLNSESSIHYPVNFAGTDRIVSITGEAYFEVAHDAKKPFMVKVGNTIVHDIGTHFNINAYSDEPDLKVSLIEGAVNVEQTTLHTTKLMRPGEQVSINKQGIMKVSEAANLESATAWKDGLFDFDGENLETVMRQLARWYNVGIEYPDGIPDIQFTGSVHRTVNASQVLDMLGYFNIHFEIVSEGNRKKIIVEP